MPTREELVEVFKPRRMAYEAAGMSGLARQIPLRQWGQLNRAEKYAEPISNYVARIAQLVTCVPHAVHGLETRRLSEITSRVLHLNHYPAGFPVDVLSPDPAALPGLTRVRVGDVAVYLRNLTARDLETRYHMRQRKVKGGTLPFTASRSICDATGGLLFNYEEVQGFWGAYMVPLAILAGKLSLAAAGLT